MAAAVDTPAQSRAGAGSIECPGIVPGMFEPGGMRATELARSEPQNGRSIEAEDQRLRCPTIQFSGADDRPAGARLDSRGRGLLTVFVAASLFAHVALYALLNRKPVPIASAGDEVITVEIVVGANTAAGVVETADPADVENPIAADARKPEESREQRSAEDQPPDQAPESSVAIADPDRKTLDSADPTKRRDDPVVEPKKPEMPSVPSSGIGHGRSAPDAKYYGRIASHLARRKQYPPEARSKRQQGTGTVRFTIDPSGQVSSIELVRKTGIAALDREIEAMVRRAAPFPAPPGGVSVKFAAPVSFHIN